MAWMQKLYETYERCKGREPPGAEPLMPIAHAIQQAHIEVTIDGDGNFVGAKVLDREATILPATEGSANRTSGEAAHPLCDKIQYCAADYATYGGQKSSYFEGYERQLADWASSPFSHPKVRAVLAYIRQGRVVADLVRVGVLCAEDGRLQREWLSPGDLPAIFRQLTAKDEGGRKVRDQGDALIRWRVEMAGTDDTTTWSDGSLRAAWEGYYAQGQSKQGLCMVTGVETALADQHPARLRHGADKAKLISSNDGSGFTFRGRFLEADQAVGVGFETSQKAHNALRWLIQRQGTRMGEQAVVAWAVNGAPIPDPCQDTLALCGIIGNSEPGPEMTDDVGQSDALLLGKAMKGYRASLDPAEDVVVMVLDAATPGRMSISYYRELKGSDFLDRVEGWHRRHSWRQDLGLQDGEGGKKVARRFIGAPAPRAIAEAAYGRRLDDKLLRATVERLLPCIVDGQLVPRDLVESTVRRACARSGLESGKSGWEWEFEKCLGIACALFRGTRREEDYQMALDEERTTRDYLFGRLLAIAERIEDAALSIAKETRDTTAAKLMARFADRPSSTWRVIETALPPYKARLRANWPGYLVNMEKLLDQVMAKFAADDCHLPRSFLIVAIVLVPHRVSRWGH